MKKILILLSVLFISLSVFASEYKELPYKNIKENGKINYTEAEVWTEKVHRKDTNYYVKKGNTLYANDDSIPVIECYDYMFISNGKLIGYSPDELKFYEFIPKSGNMTQKELDFDEVAILFKDYRIILISDFSTTTNAFKFKKQRNNEKIMILNDTDKVFKNYEFTTNNAKFEKYLLNNSINITKKGMIQFSQSGENTKYSPWYILLIR